MVHCNRKAGSTIKAACHPGHSLFSPTSGKRYMNLKAQMAKLQNSFLPIVVRLLNQSPLSHPLHSAVMNSYLHLIRLFCCCTLVFFFALHYCIASFRCSAIVVIYCCICITVGVFLLFVRFMDTRNFCEYWCIWQ